MVFEYYIFVFVLDRNESVGKVTVASNLNMVEPFPPGKWSSIWILFQRVDA